MFIKAELEIQHPDNRVEYELWYSSILDVEYWRLRDIGVYQKALNADALFTPRIVTYNCAACNEEVKKQNCYSNGEYCVFPPK